MLLPIMLRGKIMSRLIDALEKTDRMSYEPMGFRPSRQASTGPRLRIIASTGLEAGLPTDLANGADAVLLLPGKKSPIIDAIKSTAAQIKDIPWGVYLSDARASKASSMVKEGCDFLVFPASSLVSTIPAGDDTGRIIEVESSLDDGLLRAVNNLPVDAVLVTDSLETSGPLVWHQLMIFRHMTDMLSKPVIIRVPPDITESDIKAFWEAGADAVITEINAEKPDGITNLRKLIEGLPPRTSPRKGRAEAILPRLSETKAEEPEEEEEDWE
jgi:hypothetical protein